MAIMFKKFKKKMSSQDEKNLQEEQNLNESTQENQETSTETGEQGVSEENGTLENDYEKQVLDLKEQIAQLNDKHLRLYSEFDNYRKRTAREKIETVAMAGADTITSLLPVLDDFERALKSAETTNNIEALKEGINLVYYKLLNDLTKKGLQTMDATNQAFDPDLHEAITNIPAPTKDMVGKVVDEVEKGYLLNGKVIRYAKVVVGN
jgi:molecular chaperone GrpE